MAMAYFYKKNCFQKVKQSRSVLKKMLMAVVFILLLSQWNYLKSQQTTHISFGLNYGFKQINMEKTSQLDQFIYNDKYSDKYNWTQEDLDDYNQASMKYNIHQTSFFVFSGLSGSDSSLFRVGFGIDLGVFSFKERIFLDEEFKTQKNQSLNLFGDIFLYAHYKLSDNLFVVENIYATYYKNDFNNVDVNDNDFADADNYTINYDNNITTIAFSATTMVDYKWKDFSFLLGPQFVYYLSNSDYSQHLTHNTSGDYMVDNESYKAKNAQIFRVALGTTYKVKERITAYANISFWKDIEVKFGIQF